MLFLKTQSGFVMNKFWTIILLFNLVGCASMFGEGQQFISIETSTGDKAKAEIRTPNSTFKKEIPAQINVDKGWGKVIISVNDDCYKQSSVELDNGIEPAFWLNIFNGYIGFFIDVATGSMWEYDSNVSVELEKSDECKAESSG